MTSSTPKGTSSSTTSSDETSSLPAFREDKSARKGAGSPSEQGMGTGKGSAGRGASRSPVKKSGSGAEGERRGPRRVRLTLARIDPFSVMKLSFLLSVAVGIMIVVAAAVVWLTLDGMHVFTKVDSLVREVVGTETKIDILQYVKFSRIVSAASLIAIVDVFLMTALATIGAFLYNIVAALVGGIHLTMTDE